MFGNFLEKKNNNQFWGKIKNSLSGHKKILYRLTAVILMISFVVYSLYPTPNAYGATYTFTQSSWSGGASGTVAAHPGDETGWNKFTTSTNVLTTGTSTVTIVSSTYSASDGGVFSTNGFATGGGFSNGTNSDTELSGSGAGASVQLFGTHSSEVHGLSTLATLTGANIDSFSKALARSGNSDSIYAFKGNYTRSFYKYSIASNVWSQVADMPVTASVYRGTLMASSSEDYIYLINTTGGNFDRNLYRYSITGDSWATMAAVPSLPDYYSATREGNYIYIMADSSTTLYRYSIASDSWSNMVPAPAAAASFFSGGTISIHDDGDSNIYVLTGAVNSRFYKYSIPNNSWTTLTSAPASVYSRAFSYQKNEDYIYVYPANYYDTYPDNFYRYSISNDAWTTITSPSSTIGSGYNNNGSGPLIRGPARGYLYFIYGDGTNKYVRYSITDNVWSSNSNLATTFNSNASAWLTLNDNVIYFLDGNTGKFYSDTIDTITYPSSGNFTSATLDLGVARLNQFSWTSTTPAGVGSDPVKFQLAANNDNSTWSYIGPDGTSGTYFTNSGVTSFPTSLLNKRYWRYKVFFSTADTALTPALNSVTFSYSSYASSQSITATDDTSLSTSGSASGGGFGSGSNTNTAVNSGSVSLAVASTAETHTFTRIAPVANPGGNGAGRGILRNGTDNYLYFFQGSGTNTFQRITISPSSTANLTNVPTTVTTGAQSLWNGDNYIYLFPGNSASFYRYSINDNSWSTLTSVPTSINVASALRSGSDDYMYVLASNTTTLFRYSVSNNSWVSLASVPATFTAGSASHYGSEDEIYIVTTGANNCAAYPFYKYSIANNEYTALTAMANDACDDFGNYGEPKLFRYGNSDSIFAPSTHHLQKYSIAGANWTSLADTPGSSTGFLVQDTTGDIFYSFPQSFTNPTPFYKFVSSTNSWSTLTDLPTAFGNPIQRSFAGVGGAGALWTPGDNYIYFSDYYQGILQDQIYSNVYNSSGTFTSATIDLGGPSTLTRIVWTSTTPSGVGSGAIRFQMAMNNDNATWSYVGPDGTSGTYFSNGGTSFPAALSGYRYLRYKTFLATGDTSVSPSLDSVTFTYSTYSAGGNLTSSVYNANDPANVIAGMSWVASVPSGATVKFQIRTGSTSANATSSAFIGPDGTASSYFTTSGGDTPNNSQKDGSADQYFQYKVYLSSSNFAFTPTLSSATITYVVNATPEIQNVSATPNSDGTVTISYEVKDSDTSTGTLTPGYVTPSFQYCPGGVSCQSITALAAGNTSNKAVQEASYTTYTATWTPASDFSNVYVTNAEIKVTINDNEAANNTVSSFSGNFTLDTKAPSSAAIQIDASTTPATVTLTAYDDSARYYKIATTNEGLAGASYQSFVSSTTYSLSSDPGTLYVQYKDEYGNTSAAVHATTPEKPTAGMVQDTSNVNITPAELRLFIAWKATTGAFASYKVYRSTDQSNWTLLYTINDAATNYYGDSTVDDVTTFYYRVNTVDSSGNVSYNSATLSARANGIQDSGEGGGGTASPPVITNVASSTGANFATITWDTDILSNSSVGISTSPGVFTSTTTIPSMVNNAGSIGVHSVTLTDLTPNTTYYFQVASVSVNNAETVSNNGGNGFTFTTTNGSVISHVAVSSVSNSTATIVWDTDAPADSYVVYSTNSDLSSPVTYGTPDLVTTHSVTLTGLSLGTQYYFYVKSTNAGAVLSEDKNVINGHDNYYSFGTTNDTTGPIISDVTSTAAVTSAVLGWKTNELADSQVEYGLTTDYGSTTTLDTTLTIQHQTSLSGLSSGATYNYRILAVDSSGNRSTSTNRTFTTQAQTDTAAPIITSVATSSVGLNSAVITWTTNESANHVVDYGTSNSYGSIAGSLTDYSGTNHSVTLTGLSGNTRYYFRVRSQDPSGNSGVDDNGGNSYLFDTTPDNTAPVVTNVSTALVSDTSAVVTWTTNEGASTQVDIGTTNSFGTSVTTTLSFVTNHSLTIPDLSPGTLYYYRVVSADLSGNTTTESNGGAGYTFTTAVSAAAAVAAALANQPVSGGGFNSPGQQVFTPLITGPVTVTNVTQTSAIVNWTTDINGNSLVNFGTTTAFGLISGNYFEQTTNHTVSLRNLLPGVNYVLTVVSQNSSGGSAQSDTLAFNTLNLDGTVVTPQSKTTPTTTPPVTEEQAKEAVLIKDVQTASADVLSKIFASIIKNPALADITEEVFLEAVKEMANRIVDPPRIVGIQPQVEVSGTTVNIRWSTDKKSSSLVLYAKDQNYRAGATSPYTNAAVNEQEFDTLHRLSLSGLDPGTTYHFQVKSKGVLGAEARSGDFTFTTASTLPIIADLTVQGTAEASTTLTWVTNVPTAANVEYTNTKTGQKLTQGDTLLLLKHAFTINNLEAGQVYSGVVKAIDEFGNIAESSPIKFSTTIDLVAPIISKLNSDSTLYPGKDSKVQTVISWNTDEPSTSQVFFQTGSASSTATTLPLDPTLQTSHVTVVTQFKPGSVYRYWVESVDASGNKSTSDIFSVLTPQESKTIIEIITNNFEQVFGWTKQIKF